MRALSVLPLALVCVASTGPMAAGDDALAPQAPVVKIPEPGVPQVMTLKGGMSASPTTTKATRLLDTASPTCPSAKSGCSSSSARHFAMERRTIR